MIESGLDSGSSLGLFRFLNLILMKSPSSLIKGLELETVWTRTGLELYEIESNSSGSRTTQPI